MSPGIGLIKRKLETEKDSIPLAISAIMKKYNIKSEKLEILETKYDDDAGDWYVAIEFKDKRAVVKMDSILGKVIEIKEI